jgi:hypothetical protein
MCRFRKIASVPQNRFAVLELSIMSSEAFAKTAQDIDAAVSPIIVSSTVAVLCTRGQSMTQIGSGTLLAVADARFLVTAGHVPADAKKMEGTLGIATTKDGSTTTITGEWIISASDNGTLEGNKYDVALYRLSEREQEQLIGIEYVRLRDVDLTPDLSDGYFVLCGFPSLWSVSSGSTSEALTLKPLMYGAWTYSGTTKGLRGYDPAHHILLGAKPEIMLDHTGRRASMRTRTGHWVDMPDGLRGISGCSVWMIGNTTIPTKYWGLRPARIVGVETGVFSTAAPTIKATKWAAVLSIMHGAFADLRPVIDFHLESIV